MRRLRRRFLNEIGVDERLFDEGGVKGFSRDTPLVFFHAGDRLGAFGDVDISYTSSPICICLCQFLFLQGLEHYS